MLCYICRKEKDTNINHAICMECVEASYLCNSMVESFIEWGESLEKYYYLWENTKILVSNMINTLNKDDEILKQGNDLLNMLIEKISIHLQVYNRDELIVALIVVKETARRLLLKMHPGDYIWDIVNEYELALKLTEIILEKPKDDFLGAPMGYLENGYSNFITAISLARVYILLTYNIGMLKSFKVENLNIRKLAFENIQTEETEKYYEEYSKMGLDEKPEDYKIENEGLIKKLDEEGKSISQIQIYINKLVSKEFGFTLNELDKFSGIVSEEFKKPEDFLAFTNSDGVFCDSLPYLAIYDRRILREQIFKNFNKNAFDNIINTFSINKLTPENNLDSLRMLELRSIYEKDDLIIFGRIDLMQNISTFKKFIYSGHYIEYFMPGLQNDKMIRQAQNKLSTYLSYVLADKLYSKGFILPMLKTSNKSGSQFVPRAEIDKIMINGVNILSKVGDIDVLALNKAKAQILLFEFKYYKPALNNRDLIDKDKSKIEDKDTIRKIKAREEVIKNNVKEISKHYNWDCSVNYSVKSFLITSRPNFYACNNIDDIEYYSWTEFMEIIEDLYCNL